MAKPVFKSTSKKSMSQYTEDFSAGDYVFREGELGTEMYIVHAGKVEILKELQGENQQLAVLEKGDFFGEMALLEDLPRTASARALEDCTLIEIDGATFDHMLRTKPEIAVRIMRKLSRRLRQADQMLKDASGAVATSMTPEVPPPPDEPGEAVGRGPERLVDRERGLEYALSAATETLIGRRDPVTGINPEIDLTASDTQRSTSRRHAKILRDESEFFLCEEIGTMNGTFVNGERIETGVPVEIEPGDELQFGLVKLVFDAGSE